MAGVMSRGVDTIKVSLAISVFAFSSVPAFSTAQVSPTQASPAQVPNSSGARTINQSYVLDAEDVVTVAVLRHPEFSGDFLVPQSGIVQFPGVGDVKVSGLTLDTLAVLLKQELGTKHLKHPDLTVTLKQPRTQRVYVIGDVNHSGAFDWKPGWTVAQALGEAGGLIPTIQTGDVKVFVDHSTGGQHIEMPLDDALGIAGRTSLKLRPGDTVRIQSIVTLPVYVTGKVMRPGLYRLRVDSTSVLAAVTEAGGVTPDGSLTVKIVRMNGGEETVNLAPAFVNGDGSALPKVRGGDMVIVPELNSRFAVLGWVSKPGIYPLPDGQTYRLMDAVALASGLDKRGRITRIGVIRSENGTITRKVYDLDKFMHKGLLSQNPIIETGDIVYVPQTDAVDIATVLSALSSTSLLLNVIKK